MEDKGIIAVCLDILNEGTPQKRIAVYLNSLNLTQEQAMSILNSHPRLKNDTVRINVYIELRDLGVKQ